MSQLIKLSIILFVLAIGKNIDATKSTSIYNIKEGAVIYGHLGTQSVKIARITTVLVDYAYDVTNWNIEFTKGYVTFENQQYPNNCLTYGGKNKEVALKKCEKNSDQLFELLPTASGANFIKVSNTNQCLYIYNGWFAFYVYTGFCPGAKWVFGNQWLWALIPAYSKSDSLLRA